MLNGGDGGGVVCLVLSAPTTHHCNINRKAVSNEDDEYRASQQSYYNIAHSSEEQITTQPTSLIGGTLKAYQVRGGMVESEWDVVGCVFGRVVCGCMLCLQLQTAVSSGNHPYDHHLKLRLTSYSLPHYTNHLLRPDKRLGVVGVIVQQ